MPERTPSKVQQMLKGKPAAPKGAPPPLPPSALAPPAGADEELDVEIDDDELDDVIVDDVDDLDEVIIDDEDDLDDVIVEDAPKPARAEKTSSDKVRRKKVARKNTSAESASDKPSNGETAKPKRKKTRANAAKAEAAAVKSRADKPRPSKKAQPPKDAPTAKQSKPERRKVTKRKPLIEEVEEQLEEKSIKDVLASEAKKGASGIGVSMLVHALILIVLALFSRELIGDGDEGSLDVSWMTTVEAVDVGAAQEDVVFKDINNKQKKIEEKKVDKSDKPAVTKAENAAEKKSDLADVGGLLSGRTGQRKAAFQSANPGAKQAATTIGKGLYWLSTIQKGDGSWSLHEGYTNAAPLRYRTDTGATALALLAFLGDGHYPGNRSQFQENVENGLKWLVGVQKDGNFFDINEYGREPTYYAHSMATIAMCEAYALSQQSQWRQAAERGVYFLTQSQHPFRGGWKYTKQREESKGDLSVTAWALMALHTARAAGIEVDQRVFDRASLFLDDVQEMNGARYKYEFDEPPEKVTPSMTAAGLLCRQYLGWQRATPQLQDGIDYLLLDEHLPQWTAGRRNIYEWYYIANVLHNMEGHEGERFKEWFDPLKEMILDNQTKSGKDGERGSWDPVSIKGHPLERAQDGGRLYMTAMCVLILETPYRHKPILAR